MFAAPTLTSSAVTPAWRRWTSSTNAGGNDHSRPTMSPIRLVMSQVLRSIVAPDIQPDHPDDAVDQVRVPEAEADGMVGPEARTGRDDVRIGILRRREREHLVTEIPVILKVPPGPGARMEV